jgi:hypothetical protein
VPRIALRLSWRTWLRWALALVVTLALGVIAATDSAAWYVRLVALAGFLGGLVITLDVLVFIRTWDVDGRRWWVPRLTSRGRMIPVDDQRVVELRHTYPPRLRIAGSKGERDLVLNPLVSVRDLDRWFDRIAEA